ncbi:MAG: type II secretion system secretin GspD [Desulfobaccales bacterium]
MLILSLIVEVCGCASTEVATPPSPAPRRLPVQVVTAPPRPEPVYAKYAKKAKPPVADEFGLDERGIERYTARLKKIPVTRRKPPAGEKVYPIDLNLRNADLVEAIRVLADTMGINYSIDPRIKGTVNVHATGKLSQSDLMGIMEALLTINGATIIKNRDLYSIVPQEKAATRGMPVYSQGAVPAGMRAQVVFLEQTPVKEAVEALKPLLSPAGNVSQAAHNSIVLVDSPDNLDKLLQLVHLIDSRGLAQTRVRVLRVHNTDPGEIIKEVETIFSAYGTLAAKEKDKFGVSFFPVSRLNSVMIVSSSAPLMDRALYWVKELDLKTDLLSNIHIYNVENYKAKNLADILTQVYGGTAAAPKIKETKPETGGGMGAGMGMGGGGALGGSGGMQGGMGQTGGMGGAAGGTGAAGGGGFGGLGGMASGTGTPGGALAAGASGLKERAVGSEGAAQGASLKEGVRVIPDEENNLLVVVAPPHEWNIISRLLKELDIIPRQVLNEVLVAEIRLTDDLKYGIEFLLGGVPAQSQVTTATQPAATAQPTGVLVTSSTGTSTTIAPNTTGTTTTVTNPFTTLGAGAIPGVDVVSGASAAFNTAGGLTFVALDTVNKLKGIINLLASEGRVDILASPHIMAANNQEARIMIGQDVPILTSQSVPLISQQTSFQTSTVQYRSTGIILSVKPQINAKGLVTLEIAQEVSDAAGTSTGVSGSPTFTVRQAKTSLITKDNQTIVLGGLIREDKTVTSAGIPGLRKMPILGPLFGSQGVSKQKTELIVLITPHIISNIEEGARITNQMKEKVGLEETNPPRRVPPAPTPIREVAPPAAPAREMAPPDTGY